MQEKILNNDAIRLKILRLAHSLSEGLVKGSPLTLFGISGNGIILARMVGEQLQGLGVNEIAVHELHIQKSNPYSIPPDMDSAYIENRDIVVIDDVLNTGLTMMYALSWCMSLKPRTMKCLVLVDRDFKRFPVHPELVGLRLHTPKGAHVEVSLDGDDSAAWLHDSLAPRDIE
jgi:pyrimidine operon attenuation protein / uracil phosphoribosyltransferase